MAENILPASGGSSRVYFNSDSLENTEKIKNYLYSLENDKKNRFQKLDELNRAVNDLHERKFSRVDQPLHGKDKADKKWMENFMINYNSLMSKKIDFPNFMKRTLVEDLDISQRDEAELSEYSRKSSQENFKKNKVTAKR